MSRSRGGQLDPRLIHEAKAARPAIALAVMGGAAQTVTLVVQASILARIVDRVFLEHAGLGQVEGALIGLAAAVVARALLVYSGEVAAQIAASKVKGELRVRLLTRTINEMPVWLAGEQTGEIASLATRGLDALDDYFGRYLPQLVLAVVAPVVIIGWVLWQDWLSALILAVTLGLIPVFMVLLGQEAEARMARQWHQVGRLSGHFLDMVQGLATLRLFGRVGDELDSVAEVTDRLRQATMDTLRYAFLSSLVLELLSSLSTALVALVLGLRLISGHMTLAPALAILLLTPEVYLPLRRASAQFHAAAEGVGASRQVLDAISTPQDRLLPNPPLTSPEPLRRGQASPYASPYASPESRGMEEARAEPPRVRIESLRFTWPGREEPALDNLDLDVWPGEHLALVGASGSGKSTLGAILLGFVQPSAGRIQVDGTDLGRIDLASWRQRVSWLPQKPTLFRGSIRDNILLGFPQATGQEMDAALHASGAEELLGGLPDGMSTLLDEGGWALSAGQRQRLALARALIRPADLYVLDEPTAHLDPELEQQVASSIWSHLTGRAVLVTTHRVALLDGADRVMEISQGRLAAQRGPATPGSWPP
ncbi:MAG: thiol reductant ABC exporter subunit CydD [Acidimicrobiales bacterium]